VVVSDRASTGTAVVVATVPAEYRKDSCQIVKTCEHLQPIETALAEQGIDLGAMESPYATTEYRWFGCGCTFDAAALRERLELHPCVSYYEYDGRAAGTDATFTCAECRCVILGLHPSFAAPGTPRLT